MNVLEFFKPKTKTVKLITLQIKIFEAGKVQEIGAGYNFHSITIKAHQSNNGLVFVGNIDVNVTNSMAVEAGEAISIDVGVKNFLSPIYITSNISGSLVQIFGTGEVK
jgi:hypothetical protein